MPADARRSILITECGYDDNDEQGFLGRLSNQAYLACLGTYDQELMKDEYVLGATVYTYGISSPEWKSYDISGEMARLLVSYIVSTPTPAPAPTAALRSATPTEADQPFEPPSWKGLTKDKALWWLGEAERWLEGGKTEDALVILAQAIIPWFYSTAPRHATSLIEARAHTDARWYAEEAARCIESDDLRSATALIKEQVIRWFYLH